MNHFLDMNSDTDEHYMRMALCEAREALDRDEVPIGAVIVSPRGMVIGRGHNLTEALADVSAHAEMQAITAMCAGAIGWAQIGRIVYGAPDDKRGYRSFTSKSPFHPRATVTAGVLEEECRELMRTFFKAKR